MQLIDKKDEEVTPAEKKRQDFSNVGDALKNLPNNSPDEKPVDSSPTTKTGRPRGRPKLVKDPETLPKPEHVKHFLEFINVVLEHFKFDPLDKQELSEGVTSLYPLYRNMFPTIGGHSIYFAPIAWGSGVVISRFNYKKLFKKKGEKEKQPDKSEQTEKMNSSIPPNWSNSKQPGTSEK